MSTCCNKAWLPFLNCRRRYREWCEPFPPPKTRERSDIVESYCDGVHKKERSGEKLGDGVNPDSPTMSFCSLFLEEEREKNKRTEPDTSIIFCNPSIEEKQKTKEETGLCSTKGDVRFEFDHVLSTKSPIQMITTV